MRDPDVLVIGGGVAGTAAALAAVAAGARVILVRRGPGATALVDGGWHGSPPVPLRAALAAAGHDLDNAPAPLPHVDGRLAHCTCAPASHAAAAAALRAASVAAPVAVCGIAGVPWFRPASLTRLWTAVAGLPDGALRAATVTLPDTPAAGWATAALASFVEREPDALAEALRHALRECGAATAIVPAVLGVHAHTRVRHALADAGIAAGEAVGGTPSLPGWRLDAALLACLAAAGVETVTGYARVAGSPSGPSATTSPVRDISIQTAAGGSTITAGAVVLATGGFIGGGIEAAPGWREAAAGLQVDAGAAGDILHDVRDSLALTAADAGARQPLLEAGVTAAAAAGIFPAGAVRAGVESARLGLGAAAADGWAAGAAAAAGARTWA